MGRNAPYVALKSFWLCMYELLLFCYYHHYYYLFFVHIHHSFYFIVSPISFIAKVPDT